MGAFPDLEVGDLNSDGSVSRESFLLSGPLYLQLEKNEMSLTTQKLCHLFVFLLASVQRTSRRSIIAQC